MTFLRLTRGHAIAAVAALVLLLVMAMDWYTTDSGEEARRIQSIQDEPEPGTLAGEATREITEDAAVQAEEEEQTAWQAGGALDRLILVLLIASIILALAAAVLQAAGRRYPPPVTPSVVAACFAAAAALVVAARVIQEGAVEPGGQVGPGAPLGLLALAAIAVGGSLAARAEREPDRRTTTAA